LAISILPTKQFKFTTIYNKKQNNKKNRLQLFASISEFHVSVRILQESEKSDGEYGYSSPYAVFNRDEVPIELDKNEEKTINEKGAAFVWDGIGDENDKKRFATLNLTIPMAILPDLSNLPPPHVIFRGDLCEGKDWKRGAEAAEWDPRVTVTFQKNAWCDSETNVMHLKRLKNLHDSMAGQGFKCVFFEDNLASHLTAQSRNAWKEYLPTSKQKLFPPNTTYCLQPVDRHIGIQYKKAVYTEVRDVMLSNMKAGKSMKLSAAEKRILITRAIGNVHASLARNNKFKDSFTRTGTWLPLDKSLDHQVKLQNHPEYKYTQQKVEDAKAKAEREAEDIKQKAATATINAKTKRDEEELQYTSAMAIAIQSWPVAASLLITKLSESLKAIAAYVKKDFIVSFVVAHLAESLHSPLPLHFNDIDVFYGNFGTGELQRTDHQYLGLGLLKEVNLVKCENLSLENLDFDINAVAAAVHVTTQNEVITLNPIVHPALWQFLLMDKTIRPIGQKTSSNKYSNRLQIISIRYSVQFWKP